MSLDWYVVETHPHAEVKAEVQLRRQNFQTYLPRYCKQRRHARREAGDGLVRIVPHPAFACGDAIRVVSGPLVSRLGIFEGIADTERVAALLDMLDRKISVILRPSSVTHRDAVTSSGSVGYRQSGGTNFTRSAVAWTADKGARRVHTPQPGPSSQPYRIPAQTYRIWTQIAFWMKNVKMRKDVP